MIVTDAVFGNATPLMEATRAEGRKHVLRPLLASGTLPVVTGFNGATVDGRPTTLGRGGSDFSASILAAALDASELWIWTDVDGIMSADPRLVPDARVLDEVTYSEAAELAYNGAKVLHPRTLAPLIERQIPVWSKNSFHLEKPGTRIVSNGGSAAGAARRDVDGERRADFDRAGQRGGERHAADGARARCAGRANVEVLAITSSSYRQSFCFLVRKEELGGGDEIAGSGPGAGTDARLSEADRGGRERRAAGGGGRRHARHAGTGRAHLHRDFASKTSTSSPSRKARAS